MSENYGAIADSEEIKAEKKGYVCCGLNVSLPTIPPPPPPPVFESK